MKYLPCELEAWSFSIQLEKPRAAAHPCQLSPAEGKTHGSLELRDHPNLAKSQGLWEIKIRWKVTEVGI